ncbi:hypothetical protein GCM10025878_02720 [Leuconostoc gasicomitatum]|uniref:Secreted metallopeptidase n=3 Tax=Lactobacillaceae TaxID=33958 RepID=A0AAN2QUC2_9LACO|nr:hypothetical protein LEGAS_0118 [Leuconostoc gasicomitatum LMG 18811]CUW03348.1 putative secreted metallopeptidase [Leuconostoc inhae]GMA05201.1 hypothetical protein GCM10025878_02720 [Leuconostoc gasicomitatum]CUW04649.1 hypothetical protein C120C_0816 [Leuconostoc inhae]CUW09505.1 putative secreted metallopeptidase [Leuconostoc inhae]
MLGLAVAKDIDSSTLAWDTGVEGVGASDPQRKVPEVKSWAETLKKTYDLSFEGSLSSGNNADSNSNNQSSYCNTDDRMTPYLVQDLYEQIKQVERLVELLTTCDQALENLDQTISLIEHKHDDEAAINGAMKTIRKQYQALLEKVGLDGSVMDRVNQAIDNIHGQYRQLHVQNKALFFVQLENIHDQTIKYIRNYIEIAFIQKRIDYGFNQFNTFLRVVVDNAVYRKNIKV